MSSARESTRAERNRLTLAELNIGPRDKVLEIGCGNGVGVQLANEIALEGLVAAIDCAPERTQRACCLNAEAIEQGRVVIRTVSITRKRPFKLVVFDKAFSVNSIHLWDDKLRGLMNIRDQLKPGGLLALTTPLGHGPHSKNCAEKQRSLSVMLSQTGFVPLHGHCWDTGTASVVCVVSRRPYLRAPLQR